MIGLCNQWVVKPSSIGFLIAQVGAHANLKYAAHLQPLGLSPALAATLRVLESRDGINQQALAAKVQSHPSRLVAIVDELTSRGLVLRKVSAVDRRAHAVHLTAKGRDCLLRLSTVGQEFQQALCAPLRADERRILGELLWRIAEAEGLEPGIHPGFRNGR